VAKAISGNEINNDSRNFFMCKTSFGFGGDQVNDETNDQKQN
jgi:hypothetical protein